MPWNFIDIIKSAGDYLDRVVYITAEPESKQYEGCSNNTVQNMEKYLYSKNFIKVKHPNIIDPTFLNKKYLDISEKIFIKQIW